MVFAKHIKPRKLRGCIMRQIGISRSLSIPIRTLSRCKSLPGLYSLIKVLFRIAVAYFEDEPSGFFFTSITVSIALKCSSGNGTPDDSTIAEKIIRAIKYKLKG